MMNAWVVAAVLAALNQRIEAKMQELPPVPPRIGLPKIIHEPFDVRQIPGTVPVVPDTNKEQSR